MTKLLCSSAWALAVGASLFVACSPAPAARDAGPTSDGTAGDVPPTDATLRDAPTTADGPVAPDAPATDAPPRDGGTTPVGCNPVSGIECDGDWTGRCTPGCAATECCSPQHGAFACVPRDAAGACPAADLFIDAARVRSSVRFDYTDFAPTNCALVERCVDGPGNRRLLRFDTRTPNQGTADMYLGVPDRASPNFEFSSCHNHYHFNTYAAYELRAADGTVAARGHKQAFCLLDLDSSGAPPGSSAHYTCGNQGIQMGFADVYSAGLDCQWIDVTGVAAGDYTLHITLNGEHILNETNYANNDIDVPVTVPVDPGPMPDPTVACATFEMGPARRCGWTVEGVHTCTAGATVAVGCSAACGLGSCVGDTMLAVYAGDRSAHASWMISDHALSLNDDSGCATDAGSDLCSRTQFTCPSSGVYTLLTASYRSPETSTCNVAFGP